MHRGSFPSEKSILISSSPEETFAAGEKIGKILKKGDIVALFAPLGGGKTVLTKGIAWALGVTDMVTSPTYTIINEYQGKNTLLYHIDAYRLHGVNDFAETGGVDVLFGEGICVVEWSERIGALLPPAAIKITITLLDNDKREIQRL
ncbi:MAG: tRNA (adenosine(37)-N6)-threonylcarbamoyltransferase complex ATPase subunit type 1 TsaE [Spirochaetaceae bacterium]|jgi:tRNA threonylcarbamoyladenosine biosynthesis protein TsaE|nr:tRNA (adenosine(37)-N6)-threonylcarbamoyltransferase complex ATPase subunit type 1 TsaE [Spirochaetaceae bacterium]